MDHQVVNNELVDDSKSKSSTLTHNDLGGDSASRNSEELLRERSPQVSEGETSSSEEDIAEEDLPEVEIPSFPEHVQERIKKRRQCGEGGEQQPEEIHQRFERLWVNNHLAVVDALLSKVDGYKKRINRGLADTHKNI